MGTKHKAIPTYSKAIEQLVRDVPAGTCKTYEVSAFPAGFPHQPDPQKISKIVVATSGCAESGHDYLVVCPYRVDKARNAEGTFLPVYDIDPALLVLDSDTKYLSPSGLVAFHQTFDGRTTSIPGACDVVDYSRTVADLQAEVTTNAKQLS